MPEDDFDEIDEAPEVPDPANLRQQLKAKTREAANAQRELESLRREQAFLKAGVPDTKQAAYFIKGYDGELTPDAIRAAATEAGFMESAGGVPPEEQAAHERMAEASAGANVPPNDMQKLEEALKGIDTSGRDPFAAQKVFEVMRTVGNWQGANLDD